MKKTLLITLLTLLGFTQATAQEYEYVPFVREGVKWVYSVFNSDTWNDLVPEVPIGMHYCTLEIKGERLINGKTYKAMHKYSGSGIDTENDTVPIYLREENKVVYGIIPDGKLYLDCPIRVSGMIDVYGGEEFVLYDFNDQKAFWCMMLNDYNDDAYEFISSDTIPLGTHFVKRYINRYVGNDFYCIEGVGIDQPGNGYTLCFFMGFLTNGGSLLFQLSHVIENGEIIYRGLYFNPDHWTDIDEVVADQRPRQYDDNYYNLMGQPVGKVLPTTPGIYIHHGKKICVSRTP